MDAAIALTSARNVGTATPADGYGTPSPITDARFDRNGSAEVRENDRVPAGRRRGDRTCPSTSATSPSGEFCSAGGAVRRADLRSHPVAFSAPGDSGSLIVTQGGNQPVALLFAGGDGLTIGTPIDLVLQRFGVTIEGTPPEDGPPGAPIGLLRPAGTRQRRLSWIAPTFDGGSPISDYKVYRGTSSGVETFQPTLGNVDELRRHGPPNGTTYYYKVSAENDNGEGALSNEASATPTALVAPGGAASRRRRLQPTGTRTRSRMPAAGRTESTARSRPASTSPPTCSPARRPRPAPPGATHANTARTSRSGRASPRSPATTTTSASTRGCRGVGHVDATTATCCVRTSSREPTRSGSSASTTAPSSTA